MNFKDLQFSLGKLSSDVKSHIARKNPLHKQDTKALSVWIFQERNDLATMRTLAYRRGETNRSFREWSANTQENDGDDDFLTDIQDIGDKLATLLDKANEIEQQYAVRYQQYRHAIKSIREREDALCEHREKRRSLSARLAHMDKTNTTSPKRQEIEKELAGLDSNTLKEEMEIGDFKRFALREAFYIRFNAMVEYADKMKMIAGFGKYIVDLLDVEPTIRCEESDTPQRKPYTSESQSNLILNDCLFALEQWIPNEEDERPTIANQAIHDAFNEEDANLLTEDDIRYYREQGLTSLTSSASDRISTDKALNEKQAIQQVTVNGSSQPTLAAVRKQQEADKENANSSYPAQPPPAYTPPEADSQKATHNSKTIIRPSSIIPASPTITTAIATPAVCDNQDKFDNALMNSGTVGMVCSESGTRSSYSSARVYHPELQDYQMDYYHIYRNKLTQSLHHPRSYTDFQRQFACINPNIKCDNASSTKLI